MPDDWTVHVLALTVTHMINLRIILYENIKFKEEESIYTTLLIIKYFIVGHVVQIGQRYI